MKVFVYWNLHKHCWSVKALEGENKGRVIRHASQVTLYNCTFKVSEAGRKRVLREQCKNVHAGVVGHLECDSDTEALRSSDIYSVRVTYNPYKYSSFVRVDDVTQPMHKSPCVHMSADRSVLAQLS